MKNYDEMITELEHKASLLHSKHKVYSKRLETLLNYEDLTEEQEEARKEKIESIEQILEDLQDNGIIMQDAEDSLREMEKHEALKLAKHINLITKLGFKSIEEYNQAIKKMIEYFRKD